MALPAPRLLQGPQQRCRHDAAAQQELLAHRRHPAHARTLGLHPTRKGQAAGLKARARAPTRRGPRRRRHRLGGPRHPVLLLGPRPGLGGGPSRAPARRRLADACAGRRGWRQRAPRQGKAARAGHVDIMCTLLLAKAPVDLQDSSGRTALYEACAEGHVEIARRLLAGKASVNLQCSSGSTALHAAASVGHESVVRTLLDHADVQVDLQDDKGMAALHHACRSGHLVFVWALLARAAVDLQDNKGVSALHVACRYGHAKVVRVLLSHKATVDLQTKLGSSPLCVACMHRHAEVGEGPAERQAAGQCFLCVVFKFLQRPAECTSNVIFRTIYSL